MWDVLLAAEQRQRAQKVISKDLIKSVARIGVFKRAQTSSERLRLELHFKRPGVASMMLNAIRTL